MFRSYRIGRLFGFAIDVNLSFLLMLGFLILWAGFLTGVVFVAVAFGSVLLHELGHAVVARHLGVRVAGIELHFFGGAAKMVGQPRSAGDEIAIAAAGPAVSFALGGLGILAATLSGWQAFEVVGWLNLIIATFNLVPALPMDGGRILRALLTRRMSFWRATELSVWITRGVAVVMVGVGLVTLQLYLAALAALLWVMGSAELELARRTGYSGRVGQAEVMPRGFAPGSAASGFQRPRVAGGFVIRQRGGRLVIEFIE